MAIDSREKRMSIMERTLPWRRTSLPVVDGAFDANDRARLLYKYAQGWAGAVAVLGVKIMSALVEGAMQMELGMQDVLDLTFEVE